MDPVGHTVDLADRNIEVGGKPFACVDVDSATGGAVAESPNLAPQTGDPAAHAEVVALREACRKRGTEDLTGWGIFVLAHPCPTCPDALYYAGPNRVVFVVTREEEARFYKDEGRYFEPETFHDEYPKPWPERRLPIEHDLRPGGTAVYERWRQRNA